MVHLDCCNLPIAAHSAPLDSSPQLTTSIIICQQHAKIRPSFLFTPFITFTFLGFAPFSRRVCITTLCSSTAKYNGVCPHHFHVNVHLRSPAAAARGHALPGNPMQRCISESLQRLDIHPYFQRQLHNSLKTMIAAMRSAVIS